jgi:protein-L-isoaspartate(D-aspartate) O-methyltransferase
MGVPLTAPWPALNSPLAGRFTPWYPVIVSGQEVDYAAQRAGMVEEQIRRRGIADPAILAAFQQVPRELFLAEQYRHLAYRDGPLPTLAGQTISQPYVVAVMMRAAQLKPADRVLEVGTGSGYAAALLSRVVADVYTVERYAGLASAAESILMKLGYDNVHVRHGDGTMGWPEQAPFDAIVVAAGSPGLPVALKQQLVVGGRLVIPVGRLKYWQRLVRLTRVAEEEFELHKMGRVRFVPLVGRQGWRLRWRDKEPPAGKDGGES